MPPGEKDISIWLTFLGQVSRDCRIVKYYVALPLQSFLNIDLVSISWAYSQKVSRDCGIVNSALPLQSFFLFLPWGLYLVLFLSEFGTKCIERYQEHFQLPSNEFEGLSI